MQERYKLVLDKNPNRYDYVELISWLALETAVSLAEYKAENRFHSSHIVLRKRHLEEVASMFRQYKNSSRSLHDSDAAQKAYDMGYRKPEATSEEDS